ncbi:MAG: hypothetical protein LIP01_02975 [Tannerellaceae bacterium]|nr:hypothetical protein [Tannerellaceae bacterium]
MAGYHAKVMPDGTYMFRIHDCNTGIRLIGNVTDPQDVMDGVAKLRTLAEAANKMADFINENYLISKK